VSHADQCCGTGTVTVGTVTFCLTGTGSGTVINEITKKRKDDKVLGSNAASMNIKKARFLQFFFFTAFHGLETELELEP
jgi:hypothetical protein